MNVSIVELQAVFSSTKLINEINDGINEISKQNRMIVDIIDSFVWKQQSIIEQKKQKRKC